MKLIKSLNYWETLLKKEIKSESISKLNARRSIVTLKDLPKGHKITSKDITYKRPGTGKP